MRLCAVVVVYDQRYSDSITYKSLENLARKMPELKLDVVIYDNSKDAQQIEESLLFRNLVYYHDPRNIGVVPAYIFAKDYCIVEGISWLLRLDQDSSFDVTFVQEFERIVSEFDVKAVVPKVKCGDEIVSPSYKNIGGFYSSIPKRIVGIISRRITFINSMSFVRVDDSVVAAGLDSLTCLLDLSDHEFACLLPSSSVFIMSSMVRHSLSIKRHEYVSTERYSNILMSERLFMRKSESWMGIVVFKFRLFARTIKFLIQGRPELASITINNILG